MVELLSQNGRKERGESRKTYGEMISSLMYPKLNYTDEGEDLTLEKLLLLVENRYKHKGSESGTE